MTGLKQDTDTLITVRDVTVGWAGVPLLRGVDFEIRRRSRFAILGGSGCGKSTLLRHLIGLEQPMAGSIVVEGRTAGLHADEPPPFGVLFQSGALFGSLTLLDNVALPL